VVRGVIGLSGQFAENWNWNAYYQYGLNDRHLYSRYSRVNTEFQYALDAVALPWRPGHLPRTHQAGAQPARARAARR
jgi:hypothetical protein